MAHCRMQNTYLDLHDCYDQLENKPFDEMSEEEQRFAKKLIELCGKIHNEFEHLITD